MLLGPKCFSQCLVPSRDLPSARKLARFECLTGKGYHHILLQRRNPARRKLDQRDEDLLLFRELHKHEKDRIATLLQPVSDEFEPNGGGNYGLYRIPSGKKTSGGYEFFPENNKNDYDWLKTPPATPLFPSLEMEANAPQIVIQRELPISIVQPLSRFAGNNEPSKVRPKSPNPKPKIPSRSITPSHRPSISSTDQVLKNIKVAAAPASNGKTSQTAINDPLNTNGTNVCRGSISKPSHQVDFLTSNLSKNLGISEHRTKPKSRGVSPLARSTIPVQFQGFSNETPPNLKTDRSASASQGRPQATGALNIVVHQKAVAHSSISKKTRQSPSPIVTRGRIVEPKKDTKGTQILGSRMVEKVMNARKSSSTVEETDAKQKSGRSSSSNIENGGFVRTKHMEIKRASNHLGIFHQAQRRV